jgi:hypothetical protein
VLLFGLLNAILYSALLPLWEGFDEAFHYGYVRDLSAGRGFPVLGRTLLADDVWRSMHRNPVSYVVARSYPTLLTFDRYFGGVRETRAPAPPPNYEAHQAPLAYLAMAPLDALLSGLPIRTRVLWLRLFAACLSVALTWLACLRLAASMHMPQTFRPALLFAAFSCQMFYATVAHVANDWLAVPALTWVIAALFDTVDRPSRRSGLWLGIVAGAALLVKAYFLALLPLVVAVAIWRRAALTLVGIIVAAPWYVRNILLYSNLTGTQEAYNGIGIAQVMHALVAINWTATAGYMARASLWTGNNSFTSFSTTTLNAMLILIATGGVLCIMRRDRGPRFRVLFAAIGLYCAMLLYATGAIYARTNGESAGASPWYSIPLLAPVYAAVFMGFARAGRAARWLTSAFVALSAYVLVATYWVKLLPVYSGYDGPGRIAALRRWYSSGQWNGLVSAAPVEVVFGLAAAVGIASVLLSGALVAALFGRSAGSAASAQSGRSVRQAAN